MSENNPVERENMKRLANEIDAVLNANNAKKRCALDDPAVNAQDIDVLPINSLAGLPEDPVRLIIHRLGLKDRSSIACTCKRLYDLEAIVGDSLVLETWRGLISIEPTRIRLGFGMSMCLPLDSIKMDGIVSVLQRILRTMDKKCNMLLDINIFSTDAFDSAEA